MLTPNMNSNSPTVTYAQAKMMTDSELRKLFVFIIGDLIAKHGYNVLAFPQSTKKMTKDEMLAFIADHPDWFVQS